MEQSDRDRERGRDECRERERAVRGYARASAPPTLLSPRRGRPAVGGGSGGTPAGPLRYSEEATCRKCLRV